MIHHRDWDINEEPTGKTHKGKPVIGATFQNGLNDIEPDGSFIPCDIRVSEVTQGVTHLKMNRGRMGELRFGDSSHPNSFLVKIKNKDLKGVSFKYTGAEGESMTANGGKPLCNFNNGISIESTPYYKGVKMDIVVNDPLTAPLEYPFSVKTYGQEYVFVEENGGATLRGEDQATVFIRPPYAIDANGEIGPVSIQYTGMDGNLITFKKTVDEEWLRQAVAPVRIDPDVTIDDDSGTFIDANLQSAAPTSNYGADIKFWTHLFTTTTNEANAITKINTSIYSGITILNAHLGATSRDRSGNGYNIILNRITAGDWIEGTKNGSAASANEPTWNDRETGSNAWNTGGCNGSGTDFQAAAESTTFVGSSGLHTFDISVATMQDIIDNPSTNYGFVRRTTDAAASEYEQFHSSEGTGDKPSLYFEYTEGAAWVPFFFDGEHF